MTEGGHLPKQTTLQAENHGIVCLAEARGVPAHRVKHRLQISGRVRNDTEDFARGRLLLQGLGKLAVATIEFLPQFSSRWTDCARHLNRAMRPFRRVAAGFYAPPSSGPPEALDHACIYHLASAAGQPSLVPGRDRAPQVAFGRTSAAELIPRSNHGRTFITGHFRTFGLTASKVR